MSRSPAENYHCLLGELSTTSSNATEVAQWATLSCHRPQPALDNGVRDGIFNRLAVTHHSLQSSWWPCHCLGSSTRTVQMFATNPCSFTTRGNRVAKRDRNVYVRSHIYFSNETVIRKLNLWRIPFLFCLRNCLPFRWRKIIYSHCTETY